MTSHEASAQPSEPCTAQGEGLLALWLAMLHVLEQCQQAVLQDDGETAVLIDHALRRLLAVNQVLAATPAEQLQAGLKLLLGLALQSPVEPLAQRTLLSRLAPVTTAGKATSSPPADEPELTRWFLQLYLDMNAAHPLAGQILRCRLTGLDTRSIGERLDLPPRLVERVLDELGVAILMDQRGRGAAA